MALPSASRIDLAAIVPTLQTRRKVSALLLLLTLGTDLQRAMSGELTERILNQSNSQSEDEEGRRKGLVIGFVVVWFPGG